MVILFNQTKNQTVLPDLLQAKSLWPRLKGLLGKEQISNAEGLWILNCNSIHTIGMKFPIDCIFVDKKMQVRKIVENIRPGKIVLPVWGASSVIEVRAGLCKEKNIEVGDQMNVGN